MGIRGISYTLIVGSLVMSMYWSGSLENVWPMFNAIQLVTILTVMNVDMPPNAHMVISEIRKIV